MNPFKEAMRTRKKLCGTLVSLTDPCLCEIVAHAGYDCVWIDMEHTYLSPRDVLCHLNAARATGLASIVRLPQNDPTVTKQILEMGPDAILFPMVQSAKEARELVESTLYPPLGNRGFGPMRAIRYGADDARQYAETTSLEMLRMIQIEHVRCIDELEEIARIPYLDGFIFGPNDLSGSVNDFLNVFGEATEEQIRRAVEILRRHKKLIGLAGGIDEQTIARWSAFDLDLLVAGADWNFVYSAGCETLKRLKKHHVGE